MRLKLVSALCSLVLLGTVPLPAQEPFLVKDINPVPDNTSSNPRSFQALDNGIALFLADDEHETELWRSDGTPAGTYRLTETCEEAFCCENPIAPLALAGDRLFYRTWGAGSGLWVTGGSAADTLQLTDSLQLASEFGAVWIESLGLLFFLADDGEHGWELWRSDGTPRGTYMVADLLPGSASSSPYQLTEFRGRLYFRGQDSRGPALWTSDGTPRGTRLVKDLVPGSRETGGPSAMLSIGSALVFFGPGRVLWRSDGTAKGTVQIFSLAQGAPGPVVLWEATAIGGRYYFTTETPKQGEELWGSDGTRAGTRRLTDFAPPKVFFYDDQDGEQRLPLSLPDLAAGRRMVFTVDDGVHGIEPWVTDGTPAGTRLLRDVCPGACSSEPQERATLGPRLLFTASTPTHGKELWMTDGTPAATRILRDICRGSCWSSPFGLVELNGQLLFAAMDGRYGSQLWKTDGTPRGTVRITSFPEDVSLVARIGAPIRGAVLYAARSQADGVELWRTDGTAAGTSLVRDLMDIDIGGSRPQDLLVYQGDLFFLADDGVHGRELWRSDGTAAGTRLVYDAAATVPRPGQDGSSLLAHAEVGGILYLLRTSPDGGGLWRTDGTEAGSLRLTPPEIYSVGSSFWVAGSRLFFSATHEETGPGIVTSDGTIEGTRLVDLPSGSLVEEAAPFQGHLYFARREPSASGERIWRTDGSPEGTAEVSFLSDPFPSVKLLGEFGGRLWFSALVGSGWELWRTDGTGAGTVRIAGLAGNGWPATRLIPAGSRFFFLVGDDLWASDGTAAGTRKVGPGRYLSERTILHAGRLFFAASSGNNSPMQLWISDGTEAGTTPLVDAQGQPFRDAYEIFVFAGRVWISSGEKVWQTDGTPTGTVEVDLELKGAYWTPVGDRLFFTHWEPEIGWELWAFEP